MNTILNMQNKEKVKQLKIDLTSLALQIAQTFGVSLDYSHNSISEVENILSEIHKEYKKTKKREGLDGVALEFAAYIVSVMEKQGIQGEWQEDSQEFGKKTYPYYLSKNEVIYPYSWCLKRIYDGDGDDVWSKYKELIINRK